MKKEFKFKIGDDDYAYTATVNGNKVIVSWDGGSTTYEKYYVEFYLKEKIWKLVENEI